MPTTTTDNEALDYRKYFNTDADARRLRLTGLGCYGLLYGHVILCLATPLPAWTLLLSSPLLVVRWMIATHELFHLQDHRQVDLVTRLMPLMLTPMSLGYKEFLDIHHGHHRHMATPEDPEYFQIRGRPLVGFINALTAPEQAFFRWLRRRPKDAELITGTLVRGLIFAVLIGVAGSVFLWYWLPTRMAFGLAYFVFFYCEHRRGDVFDVYPLRLASWQDRLFVLLFGSEAMLATCHHDIHHRHPRVSAFQLPVVERIEAEPAATTVAGH